VLSTELRILIRDTGRVWWRLLPLILGVYLLGWLGNELTLRIAVILGDISPWLALLLFAFSFVCTLTAAIVILTLAGESLALGSCYPKMSGKSTTGTPASPGCSSSHCCPSSRCTPPLARYGRPQTGWSSSSSSATARLVISKPC
jgi:hypothetical protein